VSPPVGPTGLVLECDGSGDDRPRRLHVSAGAGGARTTIAFSGGPDAALDELSLVARLEVLVAPRVTVFAGGGSIVGGRVQVEGTDFDMHPGWLATAGASWLALTETARRPFVLASVVLGYASVHTTQAPQGAGPGVDVGWRAADGRIGLAVGKSFGAVRPYAVARAFGGPVSWQLGGQSITGTDTHHYQLGAGAALTLPGHFDVNVEAVPLGEQALVLGAGYAF
jgi:hypothetical protein